MNATGDHWTTVSNVGCGNDEAMIYDSLYEDFSPSVKRKFVKQMAYMLQPTSKTMTRKMFKCTVIVNSPTQKGFS